MAKEELIGCIDIGSTKVCSILADVTVGGRPSIRSAGIVPSQGVHRGIIADMDDAVSAIEESVRRAGGDLYEVESAVVGISGKHIESVDTEEEIEVGGIIKEAHKSQVIEKAKNHAALTERRRILHYEPKQFEVDNQPGIRNPLNMRAFKLRVNLHIVHGANNSVSNVEESVRRAGVNVARPILNAFACGEVALDPEEKREGVILADIGGGTTDIAVFKGGSLWHAAVLPVGGRQITSDIVMVCGIPPQRAEEAKQDEDVNLAPNVEVPDVTKVTFQEKYGVPYLDVCDIIKARVEEILRMIILDLPSHLEVSQMPAGLVLTGGTANLQGIEEMAREALGGMPVRIGWPRVGDIIDNVPDELNQLAYATSLGLLTLAPGYKRERPWYDKLYRALLELIRRRRGRE